MFRLLVMSKIDRKSHSKILIFKGSEGVMIDARKSIYQLLPRIMNFVPYVDVRNGCKLVKHSVNLGQTLSLLFIKTLRGKKTIGRPQFR